MAGVLSTDNYYALFPLHFKQLRPWEVCSLDNPWSFAASHSLMHFISRCTWKSSQYYIIISMMASFMRVSQKLVLHQSKCISAMKLILSSILVLVHVLHIPCCCDACLKSHALRVGVKTLHNPIQIMMQVVLSATLSRLLPLQLGSERFRYISLS